MKVDRLLFLAASATLAAACGGSAVEKSLFGDAPSTGDVSTNAPAPCATDAAPSAADTGGGSDARTDAPAESDATADAAPEASIVPTRGIQT